MWPRLALLGLLLLAFGLRVYRLPAQSLWYDEGVSWYLAGKSLPALTVWTADDIQPPLYYYLLWIWTRLAGTSEYALRFPSAFWGTLTVPLMWIAARRLLGQPAAWLAALLLALSPLHVYYAQEARMYTLLTFLGLLSSYLLLRWSAQAGAGLVANARPYPGATTRVRAYSPGRYGWAYVLTAVAALYTHYFAIFLLVAHALYVLYLWWRQARSGRPRQPGILASATVIATICVLYLPWLPFLVTRYGVDTSYWAGALKLGEVIRKLLIAFSLGETVGEGVGISLTIGYALITLIGLVALVVTIRSVARGTQHRAWREESLVFVLLYLLVPVAFILLLVQRTPKFNPRYAMLVSPAFVMIIAGGLSCLVTLHKSHTPYHSLRIRYHVLHLAFVAALIFILVTSAYSLLSWFAPYPLNQFNKADFRITSQIVRERIRPDEIVLLSSGHMFPAWAYYYGWEGWQRLPDIEVLDVNAALDLSVGGELGRLLHGRRGVWLVRWQNEITDPFDVLPLYLGTVGTQDDYGQFWHMELFHFKLPPDARFDLGELITQPVEANFAEQVALLGIRRVSNREFILFWHALAEMKTDYTVSVHLLDANGGVLANADHLPPRPTHDWRPGQVIPDRTSLALPADLPAGVYHVEIGLYDGGNPTLPPLSLSDGSGNRIILPFRVEADKGE